MKAIEWEIVRHFAELSSLVYLDDFVPRLLGANYRQVEKVVVGNDVILVARNAVRVVIVFRGSDDVEDWIDNLDATSEFSEVVGNVHGGILEAWDDCKLSVRSALDNVYSTGVPVILGGHSKGGAMAQIAAIELFSEYLVRGVVSFGSPRVGKADFCKRGRKFLDFHYAIVNGADPVPWLPLWVFGFRRDRAIIRVGGKFSGVWGFFRALTKIGRLRKYHYMDDYHREVNKAPR